MKSRPRILFVSHSASRNGASILLLHLLQWLRAKVDWDIEVLVDGRGPLVDEFRTVGRTRVLRNTDLLLGVLPRGLRAALQHRVKGWCVRALFAGRHFDLIYANTVAAWPHVGALRSKAPSLLWHIHEMSYAMRLELPDDRARELFREATAFVAVSKAVRDTLTREYEVPVQNVELIHGFVRVPDLSPQEKIARRQRVNEALGWPIGAFVVGGCGSIGWRKGTDLFLQVAKRVSRTRGYDRVRFLWVGGGVRDKEVLEFEHDLHALGLKDRCIRVPAASDVLDYYCTMDVFALTSREDPFPLVMLEAGANGLPVVCFADSGGGPEFVECDAGLTAPCQDVNAFADCLLKLHDEPNLREGLGARALMKVRTNYGEGVQAPKLLKAIERHLPSMRDAIGV